MADFDRPGIEWQAMSKDLNSTAVQRDELDFPDLSIQPVFYNAFGLNGTGGEVNPNQWGVPIVG